MPLLSHAKRLWVWSRVLGTFWHIIAAVRCLTSTSRKKVRLDEGKFGNLGRPPARPLVSNPVGR